MLRCRRPAALRPPLRRSLGPLAGRRASGDGEADGELLRDLRRGWKGLSERDRALREWAHGDPYWEPRLGACESFEEYERRHNRIFLPERDRRLLESEGARESLLELRKQQIQREVYESLGRGPMGQSAAARPESGQSPAPPEP
eukprot:TRINITY_DN18770_c0_g1_i1.p3 TRINITY_DN18770_c0_g1~~TRINITY_DN18770_c0_g1_i1.p3  ORF type:complete len:166 (+),score=52.47 TRINITY_DN18770_c0_g1_i1:68-499(+)